MKSRKIDKRGLNDSVVGGWKISENYLSRGAIIRYPKVLI